MSTRVLLFIFLVPALLHSQSAGVGITIVDPSNGSTAVSNNELIVQALLAPALQDASTTDYIAFTVEKTDGSVTYDLGSGNLRSLDGDQYAQAIWDTSVASPGDYTITARVETPGGVVYQDHVQIAVDRAPTASVTVVSETPVAGGVQIIFAPSAGDAGLNSISQITWSPGDGSPPVTLSAMSDYTHVFEGTPGKDILYILDAVFEDYAGAQSDVVRDVVVKDSGTAAVQTTNDCGCTQMAIRSRAGQTSGIYCTQNQGTSVQPVLSPGCTVLGAPGAMGCPPQTRPYSCAIGPRPPMPGAVSAPGSYTKPAVNLQWNFEVVATLDPRTNGQPNPAPGQWRNFACQEGQAVQVSRTRNSMPVPQQTITPATGPRSTVIQPPAFPTAVAQGLAVNNINASLAPTANPYPMVGNAQNRYGGDDYVWKNRYKVHDFANKTIRWVDGPGVTYEAPPRGVAANLGENTVFVDWVGGDRALSTCWCQFTIMQTWTAAGRVGPPIVMVTGGNNCMQPDAP